MKASAMSANEKMFNKKTMNKPWFTAKDPVAALLFDGWEPRLDRIKAKKLKPTNHGKTRSNKHHAKKSKGV